MTELVHLAVTDQVATITLDSDDPVASLPDEGPLVSGTFGPTNYGYLWWVTTVDGTPSFFAEGLGGQLVQVVPARHLVMVVSTYVNLRTGKPVLGGDDLKRLANAVVHAANP